MEFAYEGGTEMFKDEQGSKKKEPTAAELAEAKVKLEIASEKAKELLWGYLGDSKGLMAAGLFFNLLGMVGEFASPLFIGMVVDAIVAKN
jgi:ABC-type bacteriocin/lantibiotic exporter with double-glycine peptidase domain